MRTRLSGLFPFGPVCAALLIGLIGCSSPDTAEQQSTAEAAPSVPDTPYRPVASNVDLMRSIINLSAETYWESVSVIINEDGVTENMPQTDNEWIEVWAAGIALAESGNLLMMPPRRVDDEDWVRISQELVDAGMAAAEVALDRDFEGVLEHGEYIYNTCVDCHRRYVPAMSDL